LLALRKSGVRLALVNDFSNSCTCYVRVVRAALEINYDWGTYENDLGGDCCADLEERVAELEATTARKGNRKVSLEISGQVNRALLAWDDGQDSDAYIVDTANSSTRVRFKGEAKMKPGWKAGFLIEVEFTDADSDAVNQIDDEGVGRGESFLNTRHANWFIESEKLGRITLGQTSGATDDLTLINLGGSIDDPASNYAGGFFVTDRSGRSNNLNWVELADGLDSARGDFVRYDSPSIYGFILSTAWGENDVYDIALRFKKEWNSIRIAAGVGFYSEQEGSVDAFVAREELKGSLSVMHVPTGLYATFAAGEIEYDNRDADEAQFYYLQLGIDKKFFSYGATTIYGLYGYYEDFSNARTFDFDGVNQILVGSEVDRFGFGVTQKFDSAALELYGVFNYYEADLEGSISNVESEEWMGVALGARIKF